MIVSDAPKHLDGEAQLISKLILKNVKSGEMEVTDDLFVEFVSCIFGDDNIEFLRVIASECFEEKKNIDLINVFLDYVMVIMTKGHRQLMDKKEAMMNES